MEDAVRRVLDARVVSVVDHVRSLASQDPSWGAETHAFAGGWLVLSGAGMFVNRAIGAGTEVALASSDVDLLVARSEAAGVVPAFEVTPATHPETIAQLRTRGFARDPSADVSVLIRPVNGSAVEGPDDVTVRPVRSTAELRVWQETAVVGWEHTTPAARRASDAFAKAASALDDESLFVAFDAADDRPLGCASLSTKAGVATFGGMATVPAERRRGVQAALLRFRMDHAAGFGCDLASTTAAAAGASERNLQRHGFRSTVVIETYSPSRGD